MLATPSNGTPRASPKIAKTSPGAPWRDRWVRGGFWGGQSRVGKPSGALMCSTVRPWRRALGNACGDQAIVASRARVSGAMPGVMLNRHCSDQQPRRDDLGLCQTAYRRFATSPAPAGKERGMPWIADLLRASQSLPVDSVASYVAGAMAKRGADARPLDHQRQPVIPEPRPWRHCPKRCHCCPSGLRPWGRPRHDRRCTVLDSAVLHQGRSPHGYIGAYRTHI
jgi:hypothetical protein